MSLMRKYDFQRGFTILELLIVIIIIGVLSSLALPKFFDLVEYSRSTEAIQAIGNIRRSIERCALWTGDTDDCYFNTPGPNSNNIDFADPGTQAGTHFTYKKQNLGNPFLYRIEAKRNNFEGDNAGDIIRYNFHSDGSVVKTGTGVYSAIK